MSYFKSLLPRGLMEDYFMILFGVLHKLIILQPCDFKQIDITSNFIFGLFLYPGKR